MKNRFDHLRNDSDAGDNYWHVSMNILDDLKRPGLTSKEREDLCNDMMKHLSGKRELDEEYVDYHFKKGMAIGCAGGIALSGLSVLVAVAIKAIKVGLHL